MQEIATTLRTLQLVAHNGHNLASGETFLQDHEYLGSLYEEYEEEYDSVVERAIGENAKIDLLEVSLDAAQKSKSLIGDTQSVYKELLKLEKQLCSEIENEVGSASDGTQNLLQGIADESLVRQYKIGRRLK